MAHKSLDNVARAFKTICIESSSLPSFLSQRQAQAIQFNFGLVIIIID
jgi:hypothetical protein